ncbi:MULTISPECIES: hypothetical protein [Streptomyces]|uniref:Lipoprotein n=2 Tax=Streptomyces TaxID=1883 RepID=A0ABW7T6Y7_9ACTN
MRRKTLVCLVCLVAVGTLASAGCGGGDREVRVATGAAGPGTTGAVDHPVPPKGGVELIPLPVLTVSIPHREPTDERWCERVTLAFTNTGPTPIASGTVTLLVHILGKTGADRGTVPFTHALPAPIAPGSTRRDTWKVCVEEGRVPPGARIETREITARPAFEDRGSGGGAPGTGGTSQR